MHAEANRDDNFPDISALKCLYDVVPAKVKENLETFFFTQEFNHASSSPPSGVPLQRRALCEGEVLNILEFL